MCSFVAAAIVLLFSLDVGAAAVVTATDPEHASDGSCEDTESDLVTFIQKTHLVSKHVTAKAIRTIGKAKEAKFPDAIATKGEAKGPNNDMPIHVDETLAVMEVSSGEHEGASGDKSALSVIVSVPRGRGVAIADDNSTPSAFVALYSGGDAAAVGDASTSSAIMVASLEGDATSGDASALVAVAAPSSEKGAVADGDNSTLFDAARAHKSMSAAHAIVRMSAERPVESVMQSEDVDDEAVSMMQVVGTERQKSARDTSHVHDAVQSLSLIASGNTGTALAFTISIVALLSCIAGLVIICETEQSNNKGVRKSSEVPTDVSSRHGLPQYDAVGWSGDHPGSLDISSRLAEAKPGEAIQSRRLGAGFSASSVSPRFSATPPLFSNEALPMSGEGVAPAIGSGGLSVGSGQLAQSTSAYSALPSLHAPMVPSAEPISALCPMLVLPACESHFAVPTASLSVHHLPHEFDILGLSLTPLLHAVVRHAPGGFCLEIGMVQDYKWGGTVPRATVAPAVGKGRGSFEVMGQGRELFGMLRFMEPGSPARYVLSRLGQPLFTVCQEEAGRTIRVVSPSGAPVCSVGRIDLGGAEHLQFGIPPATDAVLVISCVLSTFLLTG